MIKDKFSVVIIRANRKPNVVANFENEVGAIEYLKEMYVTEIRNAKVFDYANTYISKDYKSAHVSAGIFSVKLYVCNIQTRKQKIKRKRKL